MADKETKPTTLPTQAPVPGRPGPSVDDVDLPTNPRKVTEEAAEKAIEASKERDMVPSVEKGSDAAFNTWVRNAHENGNPEQLTPMQAEQNIRDKATVPAPALSQVHDLDHEDTRWVVKNVLHEDLPEGMTV